MSIKVEEIFFDIVDWILKQIYVIKYLFKLYLDL